MISGQKERIFEELISIYHKLIDIEWNFENHGTIQDLNFQFDNNCEKYSGSSEFSTINLGNVVLLKRLNPTPENYKKAKNEILSSLYNILIIEKLTHHLDIEIAAFRNAYRFNFTKKEEIIEFLKMNFKPFKSIYSDSTYRAKLIFEREIYKNVLIIDKFNLKNIANELDIINSFSELVAIHEIKESDLINPEKILII